jgi:site-specific recombinase XerD
VELLRCEISENTWSSYSSCISLFFKWQQAHNLPVGLPTAQQETTLLLYLTDLSLRLTHSSIKKSLSSIGFAYKLLGLEATFSSFNTTRRLLKGIKRSLGAKAVPKQAILPGQLNDFGGSLEGRTIAALSFFGLLRISETLNLHTGDIQFTNDDHLILTIRKSKTDPYRNGAQVAIASVSKEFNNCPVNLLREHMKTRPPNSKLFTWSRQKFTTYVKTQLAAQGADSRLFASHSLRRGGASALMASGVPGEIIQKKGRWKSQVYRQYIDIPSKAMANLSRQMTSTQFNPDWLQ